MLAKHLFELESTFSVLLIEFILSGLAVLFLATKLSKFCDALEKKTVVSAVWIGAVFLAIVTSLPEAVASIGSAVMEGAMNLGIGNLCGSNTFNLLIIVLLDAISGQGPLLRQVQSQMIIPAAGGTILMGLVVAVTAFHLTPSSTAWAPWAGAAFSLLIFGSYIVLGHITSKESGIPETAEAVEVPGKEARIYNYTVRQIVGRLAMYSTALVLASFWLLKVCDTMAVTPIVIGEHQLLLGRTVTGAFLLSMATSFPELFVSISAFRLGQTNMAVANVLGSNMVNMSFIPIMHLFAWSGGFYNQIESSSIIILCISMLMTCILMLGLLLRSKKSFLTLGWESVCMLAVYAGGAALVLRAGLQL
ncbi:MAG: hypothetical protein KJ626_06670 [Verrucomicrobia bacterium]|nr:hypothetical protein [Verrucomicrobiota bacterium]